MREARNPDGEAMGEGGGSPALSSRDANMAAKVLDLAGLGTVVISSLDAKIHADARAATLLGTRRTLSGRALLRLVSATLAPVVIRAIRQALTGMPVTIAVSGKAANGAVLHVDAGLSLSTEGGRRALFVTLIDRTEEREEIAHLNRTVEHLWYTVELNPQLPWVADNEHGVTRVTERYLQMVGLEEDQALGFLGWMNVLHPEDLPRMQSTVGAAMLAGGPHDVRCRFKVADGSYRWMRSRAFPRHDDEGNIVRWYGYTEDIHELVLNEIETRWAAEHDPLTGLPNRALFNQRLDELTSRAAEGLGRLGLVMLDLDHFKDVNDILGHHAGDRLLTEFAKVLRETIICEATVARLGGDEFAILLPNVESSEAIEALIEDLFTNLKKPLRLNGREFDCRASAGSAIFPIHATNASELFKHADIALYEAKNAGRGRYLSFEPSMRSKMQRRVAMINIGREAVENKRLLPYYQPQISMQTGEVMGFEALLRRRDRSGQICLPGTIAEAFNDYEVAEAIGINMLDMVIADMIDWRSRGLDWGKVSINASAAEFRNRDFIHRLIDHTDRAGIPRDRLIIEVTEGVFVGRSAPMASDMITELKQAGFGISLDDFGTGYASLTHLREIPVDALKIDRSFIQDLFGNTGNDSAAIVSAIIKLGQGLGKTVVAEGIETERQAEFLREHGCSAGQGYLFGRPAPKTAIDELLAGKRRIA
ncbi:EAL domain-containing protein [Sphingomonas sp. MAH-20]|uniref:EAL domain-containing protein n=1 Tax=Sphingomonas horti TaxID=2682842 RepID=A0A6I4J6V3_9SPHN|nr:GGDEF and EAL domain-containing protein [Sphingomonas sp. CGMCC 1.13658]MBA2918670.1 EAL domain-containing protein [Sphingomonas sp. CGMCC 1.13658]MVO78701.1 EAL domain-containing protein [Sphingomonas horti]